MTNLKFLLLVLLLLIFYTCTRKTIHFKGLALHLTSIEKIIIYQMKHGYEYHRPMDAKNWMPPIELTDLKKKKFIKALENGKMVTTYIAVPKYVVIITHKNRKTTKLLAGSDWLGPVVRSSKKEKRLKVGSSLLDRVINEP